MRKVHLARKIKEKVSLNKYCQSCCSMY